ncbi:hypothetical protein MAR_007371 [Mya arenaria]|uniref:Uncharacterized protein n=1 Tax=Mya arenaria TaxID=6604 RepID=A0ABY7DEX9_MYAAR|nr:hypothetical protein MAR_007371 [Mya arenaria]
MNSVLCVFISGSYEEIPYCLFSFQVRLQPLHTVCVHFRFVCRHHLLFAPGSLFCFAAYGRFRTGETILADRSSFLTYSATAVSNVKMNCDNNSKFKFTTDDRCNLVD